MSEQGQRVLNSKSWRWMSGMLVAVAPQHAGGTGYYIRLDTLQWIPPRAYPEFSDPATFGCLLFLVRERYGPHAQLIANQYEQEDQIWSVHDGHLGSDAYGHEVAHGRTDVEALVNALIMLDFA